MIPDVVRFDTEDHRLDRAGTVLLRRIGGPGEGWSLTLPAVGDLPAIEVRRPLGSNPTPVPPALLALTRARTRGVPLLPITLTGETTGETTGGDADGDVASRDGVSRLAPQVTTLLELDSRVRLNVAAAVPRMLDAARRLSDALADSEPARAEMLRLTAVLGAARDAEVIAIRVPAELDRMPPELVIGPVERRIHLALGRRHRQARVQLVQALNSPRYLNLLQALDDGVTAEAARSKPGTEKDERDEESDLTRSTSLAHLRLVRAIERNAAQNNGSHRGDARLYEMLAAAGRARHAGEAAIAVVGEPARRYARAARKVQSVLADHLEANLVRSWLLALALQAHSAGENTFSYGRMHARVGQPEPGDGHSADSLTGPSDSRFEAEFEARRRRLDARAEAWPGR